MLALTLWLLLFQTNGHVTTCTVKKAVVHDVQGHVLKCKGQFAGDYFVPADWWEFDGCRKVTMLADGEFKRTGRCRPKKIEPCGKVEKRPGLQAPCRVEGRP